MERLRAFWNRGWLGKAVLSITGLLVLCCVIGILVPRRTPAPATGAPVAPTAQSVAAAVEQATTAPEPTSAPDPTDVPASTAVPATVAPTETPMPPTEVPTATPLPEPIVLKGSGKTVTEPLTPPVAVSRVVFTHTGKRNFAVKSFLKDGKEDLLVNTIGSYQGARPLFGDQEVFFEIDADGAWTVAIEPIGQNDAYADGMDGNGDSVSDLFMPAKQGPVPFTFSHDGKRNFAVYLHCAGGDDLLVNEIGAIQGDVVVRMVKGPCLWEVQADGAWGMKPK